MMACEMFSIVCMLGCMCWERSHFTILRHTGEHIGAPRLNATKEPITEPGHSTFLCSQYP